MTTTAGTLLRPAEGPISNVPKWILLAVAVVTFAAHGLADARSNAFYDTTLFWQWLRFPGDGVFALGALPMAWDFIAKLGPLLPRFVTRVIPGARPAPRTIAGRPP
jgi:hypothetical protein